MANASDIKSFFESNSRDDNDKTNRLREDCLCVLNSHNHSFFEDPTYGERWRHLRQEFRDHCVSILGKRTSELLDDIALKKRANRNNNHDFDLTLISKTDFHLIPWELKCSKSFEMPQFLSLYDKDMYLPVTLAEYWYDEGGLDTMLSLYPTLLTKPSREEYLKEVYKPAGKTTKHPFFKQLYLWDGKDSPYGPSSPIYKKKGELVHKSIYDYLMKYIDRFDIEKLKKKIAETQKEKIYGIWNPQTKKFMCLEYSKEMLTPTKISGIKGNDYLMIDTEDTKTQLQCLLRWRNHNGVSLPAWQIKLIQK